MTFELAIGLGVAMPMAAALQPFVPGSIVVVLIAALAVVLVMRRSIADFEGHVRAGSELILELLRSRGRRRRWPRSRRCCPASAAPPHALGEGPRRSGRSLASSICARERAPRCSRSRAAPGGESGARGVATPSPTEPLQRGDVLALTGSRGEVAAARKLLDGERAGSHRREGEGADGGSSSGDGSGGADS